MDLRSLPDGLTPPERCNERHKRIEEELGVDLSMLTVDQNKVGHAEERNCEQMFGHVPIPVGYAGPLNITFSSGESTSVHLPLATTEGVLVASVNRGCKALSLSGSIKTKSLHHGMTRSIAFRMEEGSVLSFVAAIREHEDEWKEIGESTSDHLKILSYEIDKKDDHIFLEIACDTDEAMGMNMVTIAAQAIGDWIVENIGGIAFVTVAGNVDSDKKPSKRTHDRGRGYEVEATALLTNEIITSELKSDPSTWVDVAHAKLVLGSRIAKAIGKNLHAANVVAALYLSTGQDAAHVVEGSLADTSVNEVPEGMEVSVRLPAILIGVRGGGTTLPAQAQSLSMVLKPETKLHACQQLAETIGAAVLAGEVSLLAAQAGHQLAQAHAKLARNREIE